MSLHQPSLPDLQSQEAMISALRSGSDKGLTMLMDSYGPVLFGCINKLVKSPPDSHLIFKQTIIRIVNRMPEYIPARARLLSWMLMHTFTEVSLWLNDENHQLSVYGNDIPANWPFSSLQQVRRPDADLSGGSLLIAAGALPMIMA